MAQATRDRWERLDHEVIACAACPRLVLHRETVARVKRRAYLAETYWGRPVPSFGHPGARLWIVGLAPGAHGANRTGRMFTGDSSGDFLWGALHAHGFASQPTSRSRDDDLVLRDARITNVVKCAPPGNRPTPEEIVACRAFLLRELLLLTRLRVILALGGLAYGQLVPLFAERAAAPAPPPPRFAHGAEWTVGGRTVVASYHPSQQNTRTGRLTAEMFARVLGRVRELLDAGAKR